MTIISATQNLRWQYREAGPFRWVLQQAWQSHDDGSLTWMDVPAIDEKGSPVSSRGGLAADMNRSAPTPQPAQAADAPARPLPTLKEAMATMRGGTASDELVRLRDDLNESIVITARLRKERDDEIAARARLDQRIAELSTEIGAFETKVGNLERFKAYVHKRLDEANVPADPDPAKTAATGCRIGNRLGYVLDLVDTWRNRAHAARELATKEQVRADANEKERNQLRDRLAELEVGLGVAKAKAYAELAAGRMHEEQQAKRHAAQAWAKRNSEARILRETLRDLHSRSYCSSDEGNRIRAIIDEALRRAVDVKPDNTGDWDGHFCPRCGANTLMDRFGRRWCSFVGGHSSPACRWASWGELGKDEPPESERSTSVDNPTPPAEGAQPEGPQG